MRLGADVLELDLYAVLGVEPGASIEELRTAYRRRARESHPDLNPEDKSSAARMVQINAAFRVLLDPSLRSAYEHGRRRRRTEVSATASTPNTATWYERSSQGTTDWTSPVTDQTSPEQRASFREFLSEVRRAEARFLLRVLEFGSAATLRAQVAILAACVLLAVGLIGWIGVRSPQPTSVNPNALYP